MSSEQKFDKIFRNKIEGGENDIPFSEAGWESARKLIDAERGAGIASVKNVSVTLAMILLLGIAVFVTLNILNGDAALAQSAAHNKTNTVAEGSDLKNSATAVGPSHEEKDVNPTDIVSPKETLNEIKADAKKASNYRAGLKNIPSEKSVSIGKSELNAEKKDVIKKDNQSHNDATYKAANVVSKSYKKKKQQVEHELLKPQSSLTNEYEVYENHENGFWLSGKTTNLPPSNLDSSLVKTPFDFIRVYDADYYKAKRRKTHYLNVEAGMAYLMGWNAPKGKDAKGFNAYAGVNAGLYLGKKSSVSIGLQIYNIGNIQQPFFNGSNVSYDFGANGTYTVLSGKSLYYTAVPINFNYSLKGSDRISIGVNTGVLCGGVNTEETFEMQDGVKKNHAVNRYMGYYEGMNPVNVMLTAGYGRNISKRFRMNAEFLYGLSDIYKSTKLNQTKERIPGIRIGMQYTLSDK